MQKKFFPVFINWLFPGMGYYFLGRKIKALILFILLEITFVIGFILHSQVAIPMINPFSLGFNLINIFTFIVQLGNGLFSVISILNERLHFGLFWAIPSHSSYELGGYYMLVSGASNYFITMHIYDTLCGRIKKKKEEKKIERIETEEKITDK